LHRQDSSHSDEAAALFQKASELDASSVLPLAGLTEAYLSKYRATQDRQWLEKARQAFGRAESRSPDSPAVHFEAGGLYRSAGANDKAAENYRRALELEPWNGDAWDHLAITYAAMEGRQADAATAFGKAIELQPGYFEPHIDFGIFYFRLGDYGRAVEQFQTASELASGDAASRSDLCGVYAVMGRYGDAEAACRSALQLNPAAPAYNNLGAILAYEGRDEEALREYRNAIKMEPDKYWYYQNLGDSTRRLTRKIQSRDAYRRGEQLAMAELRSHPSNGFARSFAAYFAARLGNREAAGNEIEEALGSAPENTQVLRNAVLTYEVIGRRDRGIELLGSAPVTVVRDLARHPDLTDLRRDERFQKLLVNTQPK